MRASDNRCAPPFRTEKDSSLKISRTPSSRSLFYKLYPVFDLILVLESPESPKNLILNSFLFYNYGLKKIEIFDILSNKRFRTPVFP